MQVGGIGSGNFGYDRQSGSHQVTECVHEHGKARTQIGAAGMPASTVPFSTQEDSPAGGTREPATFWETLTRTAGKVTRAVFRTKNLLGRIWDGKTDKDVMDAALSGLAQDSVQGALPDRAAQTVTLQVMSDAALADGRKNHEGQVTAAASAVQAPANMVSATPYFTMNSDPGKVKEPLLVRIRIRFRDITGYLSRFAGGMLAGRFQTRSGLKNSGKQADRDLRRQSNRKNRVKDGKGIPLTDSHLMDSYDSTGKYSRLGTGNNLKK